MTKVKLNTKDITEIGMFAALTAIGASISIPLGPVPITLQSLFVLLSGLVLGSRKAFFSQTAYVLLVFAGFSGGIQSVTNPSFGFVIGFVASAFFAGKISEKQMYSTKNSALSVLAGTLVIYAIGIPYMYYVLNIILAENLNIIQILSMGMFMFIPGDILKAVIAVIIWKKFRKNYSKKS